MDGAASACMDKDRVMMAQYAISGKSHPDQKLSLLKKEHAQQQEADAEEDALYSGTFCIWEEDHTLGNTLRHYIMKK